MLGKEYTYAWLKRHITPLEHWYPYPPIMSRSAWEALPATLRRTVIRKGNDSLKKAWPAMPATSFLEFARVGNRSRYESLWYQRRSILTSLVLAECMEGKGRFNDPIANALWSVCEESSWSFPAHAHLQRAGVGLPDTTEPIVDLFAAETGALLAWTRYLLGNTLDSVSSLIMPRVEREIVERILNPALQRDDLWWMGFSGDPINNWNPWINSNWLTCALLIEHDPVRRVKAVEKIIRSLAFFADSYPEDGGCDEGPSYWGKAGASLFDCLDLLWRVTQGKLNIFEHPKVANIGRFIVSAQISGSWFLNFADAPARMSPPDGLIFRFGKRVDDESMQALGRAFRMPHTKAGRLASMPLLRTLPDMFDADGIDRRNSAALLPCDVWLPNTQVMVARMTSGYDHGFTIAAKGGHNAESHNHNDVGHFVVFRNGNPILIDAGVERYTRKTFSTERYTLWTMQSAFHSLPVINGKMQCNGREFAARSLSFEKAGSTTRFALDIASAYPREARLQSWVREVRLERREDRVVVDDHYSSRKMPESLEWIFMTACRPKVTPYGLRLARRTLPGSCMTGAAMLAYDAKRLNVNIEEVLMEDSLLRSIWGRRLYRIRLQARDPAREDHYRFEITA